MFWITLAMQMVQALVKNHGWEPTEHQRTAFEHLSEFFSTHHPGGCFVLRGYAGTGKTTIVSTLVKTLPQFGLRSYLLAPTGRAAKVMSQYAGRQAYTIHKKIYRKKQAMSLDMRFDLAPNFHENTVFIVDEASMISNQRSAFHPRSLLEDLMTFIQAGKSCSVVFVGDLAQLPPIGESESPALQEEQLRVQFNLPVMGYELQEVVRQAEASGILTNATFIRQQIHRSREGFSLASTPTQIPNFHVRGFNDIFRMGGERLLDGLHYAYDKYGMENTLVVCRSNRHANLYNQNIRHGILFRDEELSGGDLVMVVRNNYYWLNQDDAETNSFIANGDMATVRRVRNIHEQHGFRFADVSLEFLDDEADQEPVNCRVLLDTLHVESSKLSQEDEALLYQRIVEDYGEEASNRQKRAELLQSDPYYNALQIKFAMAVTCHKAQGGQWDLVFVDQGYLTEENVDQEFLRWLYTACTRATKELFLVNFNDLFFGGKSDHIV